MKNRRIVIVGFMGCGKTTVAKSLAARLECGMLDLDAIISAQQNMSIPELIRERGESAFREAETSALQVVLDRLQPRIIALGGGAWTLERNRDLISKHECITVWLDAPFELCWERIISSANKVRPLAPDRESAQNLYNSRRRSYGLTELRIEVSDSTTAEVLASEVQGRVEIRKEHN